MATKNQRAAWAEAVKATPKTLKSFEFWIGIDPGTDTGFAVWNPYARRLFTVTSLMIHRAQAKVLDIATASPGQVFVVLEDARKRGADPTAKNFAKAQGAGSVKRDCAIWEDFLRDHGIPYELKAPTPERVKWTTERFRTITGWTAPCNNHGRDAAVLVFERKTALV